MSAVDLKIISCDTFHGNTVSLVVREYLTPTGKNPFRMWLNGLDVVVRARIQARVLRFAVGNLGDHKSVGDGVWEARVAFGPGYRIYFGRDGRDVVLLLLGGDKSSQGRDVRRAQEHWKEYKESQYGAPK